MKEKSIKKNAFYSFLKAFFRLVFPLITFPYASRILLPAGIGKVNSANSISSYFHLLALLGIESYAVREAAKLKDDKQALSKFSVEILCINTVSMIISYSLFFLALYFIPKLSEIRNLLLVCGTGIFFSTVGMDWLFQATEEFKYTTTATFISQIIGVVFLFLFVKSDGDCIYYAVFSIITTVGRNICNIFYAHKFITFRIKEKLEIKKHLKPIFVFFGMTISTSLYETLDTTVLWALSTDTEIGYYSAATKITRIIVGLLVAVSAVLLPRLSYYKKNNEEEKINSLASEALNLIVLLSLPIVFGLIGIAKPLILIFCGKAYLPAIPSMYIISPLIYVMGISSLIGGQYLPAINKEKIPLISYISGAIINFTFNCLLIPSYGAKGAAIGSLLAETCVMLIQFIYIHKVFLNKEFIINTLQSLFSSTIMLVLIIILYRLLENYSPFLQILVQISAGIIIYFIILMIFKNSLLKKYLLILKAKLRK
ncbi:MAG: flippase [Treponema sp.]|nr:flippase [Treponema sp.]